MTITTRTGMFRGNSVSQGTAADVQGLLTLSAAAVAAAKVQTDAATAAATLAGAAAASVNTTASNANTQITQAANAATSSINSSAAAVATSATNAATSATNAAGSATTATTQATNAGTQASAAAGSAGTASTKAGEASSSATAASGSATAAAGSASTASTKAAEAANSATAASNSAAAASQAVVAANLPTITGQALKMLRVRANETGYDLRTVAEVRADLAAAGLNVGNAFTGTNTFSGTSTFNNSVTVVGTTTLQAAGSATSADGTSTVQIANGTGNAGDPSISFNRIGQVAMKMGLKSNGLFSIGGWSWGADRMTLDNVGGMTLAGALVAAGGVVTNSGYLLSYNATGAAKAIVDRQAGQEGYLQFNTNSVPRWTWRVDTVAESGTGGVGSNINLDRWSNTGAYLGTPIQVNRNTGLVTIGQGLFASAGFDASGPVSLVDPTTSSASNVTISAPSNSFGVNLKLIGNGATTPAKYIRVINGAFEIINSAYSAVLLSIDDGSGSVSTIGKHIGAPGTAGNEMVNFSQFLASKTGNGYQKLPSGVIIQWGSCTSPGTGTVGVTYPISFPVGTDAIAISPNYAGVPFIAMWNSPSASGFSAVGVNPNGGGIAGLMTWIAIGH